MAFDFKLPELGENIETGEVVNVLVSVGDAVEVDQPIVELETDKATVEVPVSIAGTVSQIAVKVGDTVRVGQVILTISETVVRSVTEAFSIVPLAPDQVSDSETLQPAQSALSVQAGSADRMTSAPLIQPSRRVPILAAPSVRRLAREFGVDITAVTGSGARGRVTAADVKAYAREVMKHVNQDRVSRSSKLELPDFSRWGKVERAPLRGIRRVTARQMTSAWTIPLVTQHDRADIGAFESAREQFKKESPDVPLTVTAFAVKVLAAALKTFPQFNASIDVDSDEVVYKEYIGIGVAVDTKQGLLVPVVREANRKTLTQVSTKIAELADKARSKSLAIENLQGGTFTVTNLGGIGGTLFTPIINFPEVAILGISRSTYEPVLVDGAFRPRLMMPLSLSYDHRLIDGADAVRFLRWVVERLEHPLLIGLE